MIIAIEGIDGAGKNTLVRNLSAHIDIKVLSFPRYGESIHADLASRALHGGCGDLVDSIYGMATMFALDRHGALDTLREYAESEELLLCDRYIASNAAYSMARSGDPAIAEWVKELECEELSLPTPRLQVLLSTDPQTAAQRARNRETVDSTRSRDAYERDNTLQTRTFEAYLQLAEENWLSPWLVTNSAEEILKHLRG